jgi:hypothetical protein
MGPVIRGLTSASVNESLPGCSDCAYQSYCGGDPIFHHATQGDVVGHRATSSFCRRNMTIIHELFRYIRANEPETMRIFLSWVVDRTV